MFTNPSKYPLDVAWRPLLKDLKVSSERILQRAGLPLDLLDSQSVHLEPSEFYRFWESVEAEVNDPLLAIRLCNAFTPEFWSPPLYAALCSSNFISAVQRIALYKPLVAPMKLQVREEREVLTLELVWLDMHPRPPPSLIVSELLFLVGLLRLGTRENLFPIDVVTESPPTPQAAYAEYLGPCVVSGTGHRLSFSRRDAERPFLTANDSMWCALEPSLRSRLPALDTDAERVRRVLIDALPTGAVTIADIARKLTLSTRTLQRKLAQEGTSYQKVLHETRQALAVRYLETTQLPMGEISFLLGFAEPNSFYRAFNEWTDRAPRDFRKKCAR